MKSKRTMRPILLCAAVLSVSLSVYAYASGEVDCYNDYEPPIAVCDAHTVVSLGSDGTAKVYASSLDDGSYDNCQISHFKAARMNPGWCPYGVADDTYFRPYVEFCCEDIGYPVWVIMRVFDKNGNYNDCMVEVIVQDKLPPSIHCPYDVTVYCDYWFDHNDLYDPYSHTFGYPEVHDNCGLEQVYVNVIDNTTCGLGKIKRVFTAVDWGGKTSTCYQNIWVIDYHPFNCYNITWPKNYTADGCEMVDVDPHNLPYGYNKPYIPEDNCSMIGIAYEDQVFEFVDGVCKKILRTWKVIDWCTFDPYHPYSGICKYVQVIKLIDHDKPQFENCKDITVEGLEPHCKGRVKHDPGVWDHCTPHYKLDFEYKVDIYANGSIDIVRHGKSKIDEILPIGVHKVLWFVDDGCGNLASCSYKVKVIDGKAPTPVCYAQLSTVVMPVGGMVTIWAKDFDASSFDNCTPPEYLKFSFSSDVYEKSKNFICDDVGTNALQVWVTDGSGNQAYCNTWITIDDNTPVCPDMHPIQGAVHTFSGTPVPEAEVALYKIMPDASMEMDMMEMSDDEGEYQLGFGTTNFDRMVEVTKSDNPLTGISTLDMLFMQQHIFGIAPITDPAALYAADIDGSGHVGVQDLIMLRDAFLSNGKSLDLRPMDWVFYPEHCGWEENSLAPECTTVEIDHTDPPADPVDFLAVKKGDVNGDVLTDISMHASTALVGVEAVSDGDEAYLEFTALRDLGASGLQLSLKSEAFDQSNDVQLMGGVLNMSRSNYYVDEDFGTLNIVWLSASQQAIREGDLLFTVQIGRIKASDVTRAIKLRGIYRDELYTTDRVALPANLKWVNTGDVNNAVPEVSDMRDDRASVSIDRERTSVLLLADVSVAPNPMRDESVITFTTEEAVSGVFEVYSTDMRRIAFRKIDFNRGVNQIVLTADDLRGEGIYHYRITAAGKNFTGKIAHIK